MKKTHVWASVAALAATLAAGPSLAADLGPAVVGTYISAESGHR
jgi:hypothetical protein